MHKKPTEPFGYIAFGKDGSVRKHMESLSQNKAEQENEVGSRFATGLKKMTGDEYDIIPCEENDHDFWLAACDGEILVQATEIVSRDYLRPIAMDDYVNDRHSYTEFVAEGPNRMFGVDRAAKQKVLLDRIVGKIGKHYSKPKTPLWLLIWTVCSDYHAFWIDDKGPCVSSSVIEARKYLSAEGAGPFDEIWFLHLNFRPERIWPG